MQVKFASYVLVLYSNANEAIPAAVSTSSAQEVSDCWFSIAAVGPPRGSSCSVASPLIRCYYSRIC